MANLKDLKTRISSVKNTRKITQAMQMVAAAKLRRAQEAAENARPYAKKFNDVLANLAATVGDSDTAPPLLTGTGKDDTHLLVVMTAERGLCGGFNTQIVRKARQAANKLLEEGKTVKILTVGRKGREQLNRNYGQYFIDHIDFSDVKHFSYENAQQVADNLLERFNEGEFDVCKIFFSVFHTAISQEPTEKQIIPVTFDEEPEDTTLYDYEPSEEGVLRELLPRGVTTQIFTALLENAASEQGARMSAMDSATRNADEMVDDLTVQYNRTRQAVITNELIEIISGAEAL